MKVILAQPRGFCAGVVRAIEIVERALQKFGPPVYVRHEIVHNKHVVESLKAKGARFVEDLSEVPPNAVTIFSAHGVAKSVEEEAASRNLPVLNATCPLGHQSAQPGQALCRPGPPPHPYRPCRPSRGRRHDGPDLRAGDAGADREPTSPSSTFRRIRLSPMSRRRRSPSTIPAASSPRCITASPTSSVRRPATSAMRRKIGRPRCVNSPSSSTLSLWSAQRTVPTPTACAKSARRKAARAI